MISKIIQKEKERQEEILKVITSKEKLTGDIVGKFCAMMNKKFSHKQSLINLKEYLEGLVDDVEALADWIDIAKEDSEQTGEGKIIMIQRGYALQDQLKKDITELNKMIERYE